jgi:hypothetical protein
MGSACERSGVFWRLVWLLVLVVTDLVAWAIWLLGSVAENCDNGVARFECSSFASHVAAPLGLLGLLVIAAVLVALADGRDSDA